MGEIPSLFYFLFMSIQKKQLVQFINFEMKLMNN